MCTLCDDNRTCDTNTRTDVIIHLFKKKKNDSETGYKELYKIPMGEKETEKNIYKEIDLVKEKRRKKGKHNM